MTDDHDRCEWVNVSSGTGSDSHKVVVVVVVMTDITQYDGTHGGFGYGDRNADGSRILEFADGLNLVVCNTLFLSLIHI